MIERISGQRQPQQAVQHRPAAAGGFEAALQQELSRQAADGVAFSKHAMSRAEERGIEITPSLIDRSCRQIAANISHITHKSSLPFHGKISPSRETSPSRS